MTVDATAWFNYCPRTMSNNHSVKSLPAGLLSTVALIFQSGEYETESGHIAPEFEYDVYDADAFNNISIPERTYCDCCGQRLKYSCVFKHVESGEIFFIGRDCAAKIENLRSSPIVVNGQELGIALAEKAKCNRREQALLKAYPQAAEAVAWAKTGISRIAKDIVEKVRSYGHSDKQAEFLIKLHAEDVVRRSQATATAPTGRVKVKGTVVSAKLAENDFGFRANIVVDIGGGVKVWGNGGSACLKNLCFRGAELTVAQGDQIEFTATFEPSEKDNLFGFFKRPTKVTVTKLQPVSA